MKVFDAKSFDVCLSKNTKYDQCPSKSAQRLFAHSFQNIEIMHKISKMLTTFTPNVLHAYF